MRFSETNIRPMGRPAAGVIGVRMQEKDRVASMEVREKGGDLLVVTTKGYGKRTPIESYPVRGRGTRGVMTIDRKMQDQIGPIATARVVQEADDLTLISANGVVLRTKVKQIAQTGRATKGVRVMNLQEGDELASVARISAADLRRVGASQENGSGS